MEKLLLIDRDGTLIIEPPEDYQVDSLEKLEFYPHVFRFLYNIRHFTDYKLVIVSNQDGMGTDSFSYEDFHIPQEKFLSVFRSQGIEFDDILIDTSLPEDNAPTRKPRTGLLEKYMDGNYDLKNSYVIGDRITDIQLASNLGAKAFFLNPKKDSSDIIKNNLSDTCALVTDSWEDIWNYLAGKDRMAKITRKTRETSVQIELNIDGSGKADISTGLGFFDHMLEQIPKHSGVDLQIETVGDLHVDEHHTVEDTALGLGEAFKNALGDKKGIMRYGFLLPMDESLARVAIDFGGRNWLVWEADFKREKIGDVPTELFFHFFKSFSDTALCNLNIEVEGNNEHHKIEAIFKAFARAIKMAVKRDPYSKDLPSTKGVL